MATNVKIRCAVHKTKNCNGGNKNIYNFSNSFSLHAFKMIKLKCYDTLGCNDYISSNQGLKILSRCQALWINSASLIIGLRMKGHPAHVQQLLQPQQQGGDGEKLMVCSRKPASEQIWFTEFLCTVATDPEFELALFWNGKLRVSFISGLTNLEFILNLLSGIPTSHQSSLFLV